MPDLDRQELAENYGWALTLLKSDKGLWHVFNLAVKHNYSPGKFQAELRNTSWWKKHSDAWKQWQTLLATDHGEAMARRSRLVAELQDQSIAMGARISYKTINRIANNALMLGWNDAQVKNTLAGYVKSYHGMWSGEAAKNAQALRSLGLQLGYTWTDSHMSSRLKDLAAGRTNLDALEAHLRQIAANAFPAFKKEIVDGENPMDLASPYIDSMSRILELPVGKVNLFDPTIRKAMQYKNPDSGKYEALGTADFEESLRRDKRWLGTKNAEDTLMAGANNMLQKWGLIS